jgi:hypothetical protein
MAGHEALNLRMKVRLFPPHPTTITDSYVKITKLGDEKVGEVHVWFCSNTNKIYTRIREGVLVGSQYNQD